MQQLHLTRVRQRLALSCADLIEDLENHSRITDPERWIAIGNDIGGFVKETRDLARALGCNAAPIDMWIVHRDRNDNELLGDARRWWQGHPEYRWGSVFRVSEPPPGGVLLDHVEYAVPAMASVDSDAGVVLNPGGHFLTSRMLESLGETASKKIAELLELGPIEMKGGDCDNHPAPAGTWPAPVSDIVQALLAWKRWCKPRQMRQAAWFDGRTNGRLNAARLRRARIDGRIGEEAAEKLGGRWHYDVEAIREAFPMERPQLLD